MENTLHFAELLQEGVARLDPASYETTGSHNTIELMMRAHGIDFNFFVPLMLPVQRFSGLTFSPTSPFLLFSPFSDALGLPSQASIPRLKGMGSSGKPLPCAVHSVRNPTTGRRTSVT